jgi:hypothetical protein
MERRVHAAEAFVCTLLPPEGGVPLAMKSANVNMNCHIAPQLLPVRGVKLSCAA